MFSSWEERVFFPLLRESHGRRWNSMFWNECWLTLVFPLAVYLACVGSWSCVKVQKVALEGALASTRISHPRMQQSTRSASLARRRPMASLTGTAKASSAGPPAGGRLLTLHWPLLSPASRLFVSQREASSVFVLVEATRWLFSHARWRRGGCEVSGAFLRLLHQ